MGILDLLALGDVHDHGAAFLPVLRDRSRNVHIERPFSFIKERHLAHLLRLARKYFFQEGFEAGPVRLAHESPKTPTYQPGAFHPQQARPGQIHLADRPVAAKGQVAHRGKIVELGVALQPRLRFCPRRRNSSFCISSSIWWTCNS